MRSVNITLHRLLDGKVHEEQNGVLRIESFMALQRGLRSMFYV